MLYNYTEWQVSMAATELLYSFHTPPMTLEHDSVKYKQMTPSSLGQTRVGEGESPSPHTEPAVANPRHQITAVP